jgi:Ca2+-binding EF-hand superfamily protein
MNSDKSKLRSILLAMNNETPWDDFCDYLEKESNGKSTFTQFKDLIEKYYPTSNKNDKLYLLDQIKLNQQGLISTYELFLYFSRVIGKKFSSPVLAFYHIAFILESNLNISTLEFIYKCELRLDSEININEFYKYISNKLNLDDLCTIIIFKGIDYQKRGKIKIEDFVLVVDSYREDFLVEKEKPRDINSDLRVFRRLLDDNYLSVSIFYEKLGMEGFAFYSELFRCIKQELSKYEQFDENTLKHILNTLKQNDTKVYKDELEKFIEAIPVENTVKSEIGNKNKNYTIKLNDSQIYWINKLVVTLDSISVTPEMAFTTSLEKNVDNKINLEEYKKKLKLMIPQGKLNSLELNHIVEALNVNKKYYLTKNEYNEIFEILRVDKPVQGKEKENRSLMNTWVRGNKTVNYHLLPVKGNHSRLAQLKYDIENNISFVSNNSIFKGTNTSQEFGSPKQNPLIVEEHVEATESKPIAKPAAIEKADIKNITKKDIMELEKFDQFEKSIIEVLESIIITERKPVIGAYDVFTALKLKVDLDRASVMQIVKLIDSDKDGLISYNDMISFLLKQFKHRSTKLALKSISHKIHNIERMTGKEYFDMNGIELEAKITINSLCETLSKLFELEQPISKKLYEDMKIIFSHKPTLTINELMQMIEDNTPNKEEKSNINHLGPKEFEENMKSFVKVLSFDSSKKNSSLLNLKENIKVLCDLPEKMNLQQFKDSFIKPLQLDINLGLAIFQLLKNFSHKNEQFITKPDLIMLLESYFENPNTTLDINSIISNLEESGCSLAKCFDQIKYSSKGIITTIDLIKLLQTFYPSFSKQILAKLVAHLDTNRLGIIYYDQLQNFLMEYSKREKFCLSLEMKRIACSLESVENNNLLEYFLEQYSSKLNNYNCVNLKEHNVILGGLCMNNGIRQELFHALGNKFGSAGYDLRKFCNLLETTSGRFHNGNLSKLVL